MIKHSIIMIILIGTMHFFDTMIEPETKRYLSEDYAFCRLWQKIGGTVYADITSGLTHYGTYAFKGNVGTQFLPPKKK